MLIEIVVHCWSGPNNQYAQLLKYQLDSLKSFRSLHPRDAVVYTVWHAPEDQATIDVIKAAEPVPNVYVRPEPIRRELLFNRPHCRNLSARTTSAEVVWFTDCDYVFGKDCLRYLVENPLPDRLLFYPRETLVSRDHETGDRLIHQGGFVGLQDFVVKRETKAIGGIQIVPGDVARSCGYVPNLRRFQRPVDPSVNTIVGFKGDAAFRRQLGTRGIPLDIPNVFRIRHSQTGDGRVPKPLATSPGPGLPEC